ncbi:MAG TPA: DUF885 domain-containing protein [Allosphingosinicella sp.]|nr:DUF885 domain-containing protein [Allosphingosinicella sp.]
MITRREFAGSAAALALWPTLGRAQAAQGSADERLSAFFEAVFQRGLDRSPLAQSHLGIKRDQDKWDDLSEAHALENQHLREQDLVHLHQFDPARLSAPSRLSWRMFDRFTREAIADFAWRNHDYAMTQMGGIHTTVPTTLINNHPIAERADAEAYVLRLQRVGPLMAQAIDALRRQEAAGVRPPRFVYDQVIAPCGNLLRGRPFEGAGEAPLFADFRAKLTASHVPEGDRPALLAGAEDALRGGFATGYRNLIFYLRGAQSRADDRDGVWKLPNGAAFYRDRLAHYTTLPIEPAAVHALGLREVTAIQNEMRAVMARVGFNGTLTAFFDHMRSDRHFYYEDSEAGRAAYIADARRLLDEVKGRQHELFGRLPKADVIVRPVEAWRERSAAKAFYSSPPPDGSRPGIFYVNLADMGAAPKYQLPVTLYHEAIPGHHIETCIAYEQQGIPRFRRFASIAAFSEGWGLYAERLAKEIGLYPDPYDDFGRLSLSLMRACRLVVDTGIHAMRWTRAQATAYFDTNMPSSHYDNAREIDRYIVLPGQACSYYIGMRKIVELRARARARQGARFDIRAFHDRVLENGPLPLPILEQVIDDWLAGHTA